MTQSIAILKAGDTFSDLRKTLDNFEVWIRNGMGPHADRGLVVDIAKGEALPQTSMISAAIISGSHAMVTDREPWMQATAEWINQAVQCNLPILGICFGHQLLAEALGGHVDWNPRGREIGTLSVTLTMAGQQDKLFGTLPDVFPAHLTHRQSVIRLPRGARLLAQSDCDPHQAFVIGSAYGIQFHPEFSTEAMRGYLEVLATELYEEGFELKELLQQIKPTQAASSVLKRFCQMVT